MSIWDTAGAEKYLSFTKGYLRDSNGIILVFDLTNAKSFENFDTLIELIDDIIEEGKVETIVVNMRLNME